MLLDNQTSAYAMSSENRDSWVDFAKAIGIFLVVYGHIAKGVCNAGLECAPYIDLLNSVLYTFHMPLFFFLAGLFLTKSMRHRGLRGLLENKTNQILYPYIVWSLLQGAMELVFAGYKNGSVTVADVLSFPWKPRMQLWFLYTLFWIFIAGAIAFYKTPRSYQPLILLAATGIYFAKVYVHDTQVFFDIARCLVYFVLGACFIEYKDKYFESNHLILPVALVTAIGLEWYFHMTLGLRDETSQHWLKLPIAISCIMVVISTCWSLSRFQLGWLAFLGASSMSIYTMHTMIGVATRAFLAKGLHIRNYDVHTITATLLGLLLPLVIVRFGGRAVELLFYPPPALELGRRTA
jgi:fucose 4-O-acetylase-like acetyltransferase